MKKAGCPTGFASTARVLAISLAGKKLLSIKLNKGAEANAQQFYFSRSLKDIKSALKIFAENGKKLNLHNKALVFEPGCNVGKYLFYFSDLYECQIYGADVYPPACKVADCAALFHGEKIILSNLLSGKLLESFSDQHFDLVFISSHLAHVTHLRGGVKTYLERLTRIGKTTVFIEKNEDKIKKAARELGFWIAEWKHLLLGHYNNRN